jgi:glycosyltransferase involved in cell wall biosynthesis
VRAAVDDVEICRYLLASARMTGDTAQIIANRTVRQAGSALARRMRPAFIYQRHAAFMFVGAELSRILRVPLVLEWNGSEVWTRENWTRGFAIERLLDPLAVATEREVLSRATIVAAVSDEAAEMAVQAGASEASTIVLPNAVDLQYVDETLDGYAPVPLNESVPLIGWAGSFGPWHGGEVIVRALSLLPPQIRLVMVGDGDSRPACERLATRLGVGHRIEWAGAIPNRDALRRLSSCDILVSPQTPLPDQPYFQSPIKIFEYMALGRPIVASRIGQIAQVLTDRRTARLVTAGDERELSVAILEVLRSPDRGRALAEAARREVAMRHTWEHRVQAVISRLSAG